MRNNLKAFKNQSKEVFMIDYDELKKTALKLRILTLNSIFLAGSGHPGSSLSCLDILLYLYKNVLKVNSKNPKDLNNDRFVLSKGHAAPSLYAVLAECGFFSFSELKLLRKFGSKLQGHPNCKLNGVDVSTGSLGQGSSVACGIAAALKLDGLKNRVFCLLGDGELQEGQVFESFSFAAFNKLCNLCFIVDYNNLQISGSLQEVLGFCNLGEKFKSFGLNVVLADGHNFFELEKAFKMAEQEKEKPTVVVAKTVKGKGVSFMENNRIWHGKTLKEEEYLKAVKELENGLKNYV